MGGGSVQLQFFREVCLVVVASVHGATLALFSAGRSRGALTLHMSYRTLQLGRRVVEACRMHGCDDVATDPSTISKGSTAVRASKYGKAAVTIFVVVFLSQGGALSSATMYEAPEVEKMPTISTGDPRSPAQSAFKSEFSCSNTLCLYTMPLHHACPARNPHPLLP